MRLPLSLSRRILIWLGIQLGLMGVVGWVLLVSESPLEILLARLARPQVQRVASLLLGELRNRSREDWSATLGRFGAAYRIECTLVREDGRAVAGSTVVLPESVRSQLATDILPPARVRRAVGDPPHWVRTSDPVRHWWIAEAGFPEVGERAPLRLVFSSPTLSAHGVFFDVQPWLWVSFVVLGLSVLWWLPWVRRLSRHLRQLAVTTEQIGENCFAVAPTFTPDDELGRLEQAIRQLAARLDGYAGGEKHYLNDVAAELRAPLERMEASLERLGSPNDPRFAANLESLREDLGRMTTWFKELTSFSQVGGRGREITLNPVELRPVVQEVLESEAGAQGLVQVAVPPGLRVRAEHGLLSKALMNLVKNAVRHAGTSGPIELSAVNSRGVVLLVVSDSGPGVPQEALGRLGEPFYRPNDPRTREGAGVGLGLAIVRACVEACQGRVEFRNRRPQGFEAEIQLAQAV